jgi:hypothetical protein
LGDCSDHVIPLLALLLFLLSCPRELDQLSLDAALTRRGAKRVQVFEHQSRWRISIDALAPYLMGGGVGFFVTLRVGIWVCLGMVVCFGFVRVRIAGGVGVGGGLVLVGGLVGPGG